MLSQRSKYLVLGLIGIGFISFVATFTWMVWSPSAARKPALTVNAGERSENGAYKEEAKNSKSAKPAIGPIYNEPAGENEKRDHRRYASVQESRYRLCGHVEVGIPSKTCFA